MDLHANLNQFAAADIADPLVFRQGMLYDFYRSPFWDHVVNTTGTALAGHLLFAFFSGFHAVCIPSLRLIEQMGKLLHDHLVQLLRGASKQFPLIQLQLLHQPMVLQKGLGQLGALGIQQLVLLGQLCLHRFVFRTGNCNRIPVTCFIHFCMFHGNIIP